MDFYIVYGKGRTFFLLRFPTKKEADAKRAELQSCNAGVYTARSVRHHLVVSAYKKEVAAGEFDPQWRYEKTFC